MIVEACVCILGDQAIPLQNGNAKYKLCSCLINTICRFPIAFSALFSQWYVPCAHYSRLKSVSSLISYFSFSIYDFCLWLEPCNCCKAHCKKQTNTYHIEIDGTGVPFCCAYIT